MRALLIALGAVAGLASAGDHPAVKIIALLEKLVAQVKEEADSETATYAEFTTWCVDIKKEKAADIAAASDELTVSLAKVEALTSEISQLEKGIAELATELANSDQSKTDASNERDLTNTAYLAQKSDLDATIAAVAGAMDSLEATDPGSALLIQQQVEKVSALVEIFAPSKAGVLRGFLKRKAFLQREEPMTADASVDRAQGGGERDYDFKSGGVIEILKQLKLKFEDELEDCNKAETASLNAWKLLDASTQDRYDAADTAKTTKEAVKARKGQELATAEADRDDADYAKRAGEAVLAASTSACASRAEETAERQERRVGEIAAMEQAKEVLSKVTGVRAPASKLDADDVSFSFLQLQENRPEVTKIVNLLRTAQQQASKFLKTEKAGHQAEDLGKLADSIAKLGAKTGKNNAVFFEIKSMIESMVNHLMSEQRDEDTHKNWCDKETLKSETMETDHETKRDELVADIALLDAEIDTLSNAVTTNNNRVAELETDIEDQTKTRTEEMAENKATIEDSQKAQMAVANAIAVLEDFYKSVGGIEKDDWDADAGTFVQLRDVRRSVHAPDAALVAAPKKLLKKDTTIKGLAPSQSQGAYSGTSGGTDVIGMLKDVAADFSAMEQQAITDETAQTDTYNGWLKTAKENKATAEHDSEMKTTRIEALKAKNAGKNGDLLQTKAQLEATVKYLKNLEPPCEEGDSTYADRKASRTSEIEALKEASKILQGAFD